MPSSPSLQIPHMLATDTGKYAEANAAINDFDAAFCNNITEQVGGSPYVSTLNVPDADYDSNIYFFIAGNIATNITVNFPARSRFIIVQNITTNTSPIVTITLQVGGGGGGVVVLNTSDQAPHMIFVDAAHNRVYKVS